MLADAFHEGGWPMYPILVVGVAALATAIRFAAVPSRRGLLHVAVALGAVTALLGALGTSLGLMASASHIVELPLEQKWIFLIGVGESLNDAALALLLAVATGLALTAGLVRASGAATTDAAPTVYK